MFYDHVEASHVHNFLFCYCV